MQNNSSHTVSLLLEAAAAPLEAAALSVETELFLASFGAIPFSAIAASLRAKFASPALSRRPLDLDVARLSLLENLEQASAVGALLELEDLLTLMARMLDWATSAGVAVSSRTTY